jgi:hypothetical protein
MGWGGGCQGRAVWHPLLVTSDAEMLSCHIGCTAALVCVCQRVCFTAAGRQMTPLCLSTVVSFVSAWPCFECTPVGLLPCRGPHCVLAR